MKITIPGQPIPKARARFARRGKFVTTYDIQDKVKKKIKAFIKSQVSNIILSPSTLYHVEMIFCIAPPLSWPQRALNQILWDVAIDNHIPKFDCDNLEKFILDVCNGVLWHDDRQIISLQSKKSWAIVPETIITVSEVTSMLSNEEKRILDNIKPKLLETYIHDHAMLNSYWHEYSMAKAQYDDEEKEIAMKKIAAQLKELTKYNKVLSCITKEAKKQDKQLPDQAFCEEECCIEDTDFD